MAILNNRHHSTNFGINRLDEVPGFSEVRMKGRLDDTEISSQDPVHLIDSICGTFSLS